MRELEHRHAASAEEAVAAVAGDPDACFLAGGTNLVDHLKLRVATPRLLVDVSRLPLDGVEEYDDGSARGVRVGAGVRNSDLAAHPLVRERFPAVARALLAGASPQIRHQATTAGNLLQRTRCVYFQDVTTPCNKREPGSGCPARDGYARQNAVLGASDACVATHPSDLAVSLAALDAQAVVLGPAGQRRVPVAELHRLPGDRPDRDTVLEHGDLVVAVELPEQPVARASTYLKARERASFAFALASVAAGVVLDDDGVVSDVRIAWGGVAHKPWRATRAEAALRGRLPDPEVVREAAEAELAGASTSPESAYKVPLVRNLTVRAIVGLAAAAGTGADR